MVRFIKNIQEMIKLYAMPTSNVRVVVLGHQKSGTTAIAALLGKISDLEVSIDPLYFVDWGKGGVAETLINEPGKFGAICRRHPRLFGQPIIKDPDLIYTFSSVKANYRNAKYLFVARDPRDTIRSVCNRLELSGRQLNRSLQDVALKRANRHWDLILSGSLPKQNIHLKTTSMVNILAQRWNLSAELYLRNSDEMLFFRYEDFLKDKERSIAKTAMNLGIPHAKSIAEYVDIQYQPGGCVTTDWEGFFGTDNLNVIESVCADALSEFGYPTTSRD